MLQSKATEDITKQNLKECFAMKMNAASIKNQKAEWEALGVKLPAFDHEAMTAKTKEHPVWVHFGAGNIFRGFIAALQQGLLNVGVQERGIISFFFLYD